MTELSRVYGLDYIESALEAFQQVRSSRAGYQTLRLFLPYCLIREGDEWIPLNVDRKPLGTRRGWYEYSRYNFIGIPARYIDGSKAEVDELNSDRAVIFLFTEETAPSSSRNRKMYFDRMREVFKNRRL